MPHHLVDDCIIAFAFAAAEGIFFSGAFWAIGRSTRILIPSQASLAQRSVALKATAPDAALIAHFYGLLDIRCHETHQSRDCRGDTFKFAIRTKWYEQVLTTARTKDVHMERKAEQHRQAI
jgi:hypothetical protein